MSRYYTGKAYNGPTSNYKDAAYETLEEAKKAAEDFLSKNPVGWNIFDSESHELVDGFDCFEGLK